MDLEFEIPIDGEIDEEKLESGGRAPAGWYMARVEDVYPDTQHPLTKLKFRITDGAYKGTEVTDSLWDPASSDSADKAKTAMNRLLLITGRIGAREPKSNRISFPASIGREVVLHLTKRKDSEYVNVDFGGVYPPDHEKIPDEVRKALGITAPKKKRDEGGSGGAGRSAPAGPALPGMGGAAAASPGVPADALAGF